MIEYYARDGTPMTEDEWLRSFSLDPEEFRRIKRVALTEFGDDDIRVSTVWLGLNHNWDPDGPPLIFETMVFGGPLDNEVWRCTTEAQAVEQHGFVVSLVRRELEVGE